MTIKPPDLPSDAELLKFLRTRKGTYDYMEPQGCALGQFLTENDVEFSHMDKDNIYLTPIIDDTPELSMPLPDGWDRVVKPKPWTFEAAAERAEKILG